MSQDVLPKCGNPGEKNEIHARKLWILEDEEVDSIRETTELPGLGLILRVDTEVRAGQSLIRHETRYAITSLAAEEVSAERLMTLVRGHWCVENGLHSIKDRWWDEDRQWSLRAGLAERLATLRDTVLRVLRRMRGVAADLPIRSRADHLGRILPKALKLIGLSSRDFAILPAEMRR